MRQMSFLSLWKRILRESSGPRTVIRRRRRRPQPANPEYAKHRALALERICSRVEYFNTYYGYTYGRITIRDQRTRWGSCSHRGNLSFNYRLALLPAHLMDYVVIHELCHLREMNHSAKFWALVAEQCPEYRAHRQELRSHRMS